MERSFNCSYNILNLNVAVMACCHFSTFEIHFSLFSIIAKRCGNKWDASSELVIIDYASSEGSGEPAHPRSLARTFAARSYKQ